MASEKNTIMGWVDRRLPVTENLERHLTKHPVPKKVNFFYLFGALLMVVFMIQVVTGIWLMMFYTNTEEGAFASVEYIMRDVEYGWLMRYMHSTGASAFFFLMYFHMFRGLLYGSYQKPKELVWLFGCFLLFLIASCANTPPGLLRRATLHIGMCHINQENGPQALTNKRSK